MPEEGPDQADIDSRLIMVGPFQAARLGPLEAVPATRRQHAGYSWIYSLTHLTEHHAQTAQASRSYPPVTYILVPHPSARRSPRDCQSYRLT